MSRQLLILLGSAATIAFFHTLLGPDHYLPFMVVSKARQWSLAKTTWVTLLCGLGHIAGSIVLGLLGIAAGITLKRLELIESIRGNIAAWFLMAFGLVYFAWGGLRALRNKPHTHEHNHPSTSSGHRLDSIEHGHEHTHHADHVHLHDQERKNLTPWILFIIFVFGPFEPLIPLLMYPAAAESFWAVAIVVVVFSIVTIATMTGIVLLSAFGLSFVSMKRLERYSHVLAGATIFLCGIAIHYGF